MIDWHVAFLLKSWQFNLKISLALPGVLFCKGKTNLNIWCCCFVLNFTCARGYCMQVLLAEGNFLHNYAIISMAFATLKLYWSKPLCLWCQMVGTWLPVWVTICPFHGSQGLVYTIIISTYYLPNYLPTLSHLVLITAQ